ncbi:hypothetical protein CDAR_49091 [Caerostris darwini]|uniref:Uncharacterized protein n=1 Tax=Caerostris darwini TaxID=1538125 RepID=A0AAV4NK57_9ARAC|nr:hypothetical protein CDAR_49091 [Caerostris darwini]
MGSTRDQGFFADVVAGIKDLDQERKWSYFNLWRECDYYTTIYFYVTITPPYHISVLIVKLQNCYSLKMVQKQKMGESRSDLIAQIISFPELMASRPKTPFGPKQLITSQLGSWQDSRKSGS